jgi:hypothetical protein
VGHNATHSDLHSALAKASGMFCGSRAFIAFYFCEMFLGAREVIAWKVW